jgi:hypothetical protein
MPRSLRIRSVVFARILLMSPFSAQFDWQRTYASGASTYRGVDTAGCREGIRRKPGQGRRFSEAEVAGGQPAGAAVRSLSRSHWHSCAEGESGG